MILLVERLWVSTKRSWAEAYYSARRDVIG